MQYHPFPNRETTKVSWGKIDPNADWVDRCNRLPKEPVFDILIMCDDKEKAYLRLEEDYEALTAVMFPNGNKIVRLVDGRFATVSDRPDQVVGLLPQIERWNWYGKFTASPDLAILREKRQVEEILRLTKN